MHALANREKAGAQCVSFRPSIDSQRLLSESGGEEFNGTATVSGAPDSYEGGSTLDLVNNSSEEGTCTKNDGVDAFSLGGPEQVTELISASGSDQYGSFLSIYMY
jgi:hypothetical protein